MNELINRTGGIEQAREINERVYQSFISYLDTSPRTAETYSRAIKQFMKYLKNKGVSRPTRDDVISYREQLKADHTANTVQSYIIAIRLFFAWAEQAGVYPNIAKHIKGAKISRDHKKDYLTTDQVKNILKRVDRDTTKGKRNYAILALMVTCGLRDIEVSRANIEDLRTRGNNTVLYVQGKGKEERADFIRVPAEVEKAIRDYLTERGTAGKSEPLFTSLSNNNQAGRLTTRSISGVVKESMKNAGYNSDRLTAHSLRHTAVTLALIGGQSLQEAQQFARHANISTTQIYAHNLEMDNNQCSNVVAGAIF